MHIAHTLSVALLLFLSLAIRTVLLKKIREFEYAQLPLFYKQDTEENKNERR